MIIVDSSVWIDYFNGRDTPHTNKLDSIIGIEPLVLGDVILMEVLQGLTSDVDFKRARALFEEFEVMEMLGEANAVAAATNYRSLRKSGITIRSSIDCIIATFCITQKHSLLFQDRDYRPFVEKLKLRPVAV